MHSVRRALLKISLLLPLAVWGAMIFFPIEVSLRSSTRSISATSTAIASTEAKHIEASQNVSIYTYRISNSYPHDPNAFTQGLVYADGFLYEGTGLHGKSTLRKVDLKTGRVLQQIKLPDQFFGEGVTLFNNRIVQLTWRSNIGFVYDMHSFKPLLEFNYPTEGWGLTHDGEHLIMSDGTSNLYLLDPKTFEELGRINVHDNNGPLPRLNELEYVRGEVYANIWMTDRIVRIDPQTGQVQGWIDLQGLLGARNHSTPVGVLNGIAYDARNDRLFVTGKLWPKIFEIKLVLLNQ